MSGYTINGDGSITCGRCGNTSHNPEDVTQHYCGHCKIFHDDETAGDAAYIIAAEADAPQRQRHDRGPHYIGEPSYELVDALKLPLLFHAGGPWDAKRRAEWLRITGSLEATSKVMCDHLRSAVAMHFGVNA
jgi:hypothetical protein